VPIAPQKRAPLVAFLALSLVTHGAAVAVGLRARTQGVAPEDSRRVSPEATGDTFEIPTEPVDSPETIAPASAAEDPAGAPPRTAMPAAPHDRAGAAPVPPHARIGTRPTTSSPEGATAGEETRPSTALFGAVGERAAAPLAATFTRGFPQAASADPLWITAPLGPAGTVDVDLTLDDQGALIDSRTSGASVSPALAEGVRRTLALIKARSFVAAARVTRLRVTATVTPDQIHDGLHGEVFAIGGTFDDGQGNGFFALAVGRRIDVQVRVVPASNRR
jgi:hypothetical protein